jgi:hypothetical protein
MVEHTVRKLLGVITLLSMVLIISGCKIDGEEEIEIHADGALTMRLNYQFPQLGLSLIEGKALVAYLQGLDDRHESISMNVLSCERASNATVRIIAEIHSKDAMQLGEIMAAESAMLEGDELLELSLLAKLKAIIGEISIGVEELNIKFSRTIKLDDLLKSELPNINRDLLGNYQFRYSLTSPRPARNHNATTTSNNGKTLTWVMPLKQYVNEPFIMQATLPIPIPWWVWLLVGLAILVMLLVLWKIFCYLRRKFKS